MADDILVFGKGECTEEAYQNHDEVTITVIEKSRNISINSGGVAAGANQYFSA